MLSLEIQEMVGEAQGAPLLKELEKVEKELSEVRKSEGERLRHAMAVLDNDQLALVAETLRGEREVLERRLRELQSLVNDSSRRIPTEPRLLQETSPEILQDALHRSVNWIALTDRGAVAYCKTRSFFGGKYMNRSNDERGRRQGRTVLPPDMETLSECLEWFGEPDLFVAGRRYSLGDSEGALKLEEIVPIEFESMICKENLGSE
jgi:hypothetical protein